MELDREQQDGKEGTDKGWSNMRIELGTFEGTRPQETGENVTKSRMLGHQKVRNPLVGLNNSVYVLVGRCTYPF